MITARMVYDDVGVLRRRFFSFIFPSLGHYPAASCHLALLGQSGSQCVRGVEELASLYLCQGFAGLCAFYKNIMTLVILSIMLFVLPQEVVDVLVQHWLLMVLWCSCLCVERAQYERWFTNSMCRMWNSLPGVIFIVVVWMGLSAPPIDSQKEHCSSIRQLKRNALCYFYTRITFNL